MKYDIKQYTKDECYSIAKQCDNYFQMQLNDISAYITARENGWIKTYDWFTEVKTTMKYDFESIENEVIKYSGRMKKDFKNESPRIYKATIDRKWMFLFESYFVPSYSEKGYWNNKQSAYKETLQYEPKKLTENNKINKEMEFTEQSNLRHPNNYWTRDKVEAEAKLYKTLKEFHDHSGSAYAAAARGGYLDKLADKYNLVRSDKMPAGYWTFEKCKEEAKKYKSRNDFCIGSSGAYDAASRNGWLDMLGDNIKLKTYPAGYWTYEHCYEAAMSCQTKNEFRNTYQTAYTVLKKSKALSDFEGHWVGGRPAKNIREIELSPEGKKYKETHPDSFPWMS